MILEREHQWLIAVILLCLFVIVINAEEGPEHELGKILATYNRNHVPHGSAINKPVLVDLNIYVDSVSSISVSNMDYNIEILLRQRWIDKRLELETLPKDQLLPITMLKDKIWLPDVFFRNAKGGSLHTITEDNNLVRLAYGGVLTYSQKLTLHLACPMNLWNFPFDTQICQIDIGSYANERKVMILKWWDDQDPDISRMLNRSIDTAIRFNPNLNMRQFSLEAHKAYYCHAEFVTTGSYSCLMGELVLRRRIGFYIIAAYGPSVLLVLVAYASFFINPKSNKPRLAITQIGIWTQTKQSYTIIKMLPTVSYMKALDVWYVSCFFFGFACFLEFVIAVSLIRKDDQKEKKLKALREYQQPNTFHNTSQPDDCGEEKYKRAKNLDRFFIFAFPIAFFTFNCVYWIVYLGIAYR